MSEAIGRWQGKQDRQEGKPPLYGMEDLGWLSQTFSRNRSHLAWVQGYVRGYHS